MENYDKMTCMLFCQQLTDVWKYNIRVVKCINFSDSFVSNSCYPSWQLYLAVALRLRPI